VKSRSTIVALAAAIALGAAWPWFAAHTARATGIPPAPISSDYKQRDRLIAFYEKQVRRDPQDQITQRMLGGEYLQRFREAGDMNDVTRAQAMGTSSLRLQPQGNVQALGVIASSDIALHKFGPALAAERAAVAAEPFDENARAQTASILMELGRYNEAASILLRANGPIPNPTWMSIRARYLEISGDLPGARDDLSQATQIVDRILAVPAYTRSWYHVRDAQLAFEAGDSQTADAEFAEALRIFPDNAMALLYQAKFYRAHGDWNRALVAAARSAELYPLPQALGYQADAQRALGDETGARETDGLIRAEQRLYNVAGVNDRLLAMYYAEHHEYLTDALAAAKSDLRKRGDEVYADDTMAWVLAAMGRWQQARIYAVRATRLGTADPELQYHAGIIALHTGHQIEARSRLRACLSQDAAFHPFYADDARQALAAMAD
jgi:tetratricopeptide (TPR) repeat protein